MYGIKNAVVYAPSNGLFTVSKGFKQPLIEAAYVLIILFNGF
jgi:hypothetical protein